MKINKEQFFSCKRATYLISKRQETTLSFQEKFALKFHLSLCDACRKFNRQSKLLDELFRHFTNKFVYTLSKEKKEELNELIRNHT